jgi:hypothetical protein
VFNKLVLVQHNPHLSGVWSCSFILNCSLMVHPSSVDEARAFGGKNIAQN